MKVILFSQMILTLIWLSCGRQQPQATGAHALSQSGDTGRFYSERIRDTAFEDVIELTDNDVVTDGANYTFKASIPRSSETPVLFVLAKVPLSILSGIYPEFPRLIVIAPNWNYYDEVSRQRRNDLARVELRTSAVVYEFNRENGTLQTDSVVVMGRFPEMKFVPK